MQAWIKMFRGPGLNENRGGGLFMCEFDISATLVNLHMHRYIWWHNLILKTCCYHISDNKIANVYIHKRFQFLAEMRLGHGHCGPPLLNLCLSIWILDSSLKWFVTTYWLYFSFSISVFLFIFLILLSPSIPHLFKHYLFISSHSKL
jgi:hypothetical protein